MIYLLQRRHILSPAPQTDTGTGPRIEWRDCGRFKATSTEDATERAAEIIGDRDPEAKFRVAGISTYAKAREEISK